MPHLAPLAWAVTPILFWAILLSFSASIWWSSTPTFPIFVETKESSPFSSWNWN